MSKIIRLLGSVVFSLFMYSVPVMTVVSFVRNFAPILRLIFLLISCLQLAFIISSVYDQSD